MNFFAKKGRGDFLKTIQKAYHLAKQKNENKDLPLQDLMHRTTFKDSKHSRRDFMSNSAKLAASIGLAGFASACKKIDEDFPNTQFININSSYQKNNSNNKSRIAIIGGGIAGLNCAYELKKYGFNATIYEASDRSGGRIFSKKDFIGNGLITECGGEFIDTRHRNMLKLVADFQLPLIDTLSSSEANLQRDSFYIDGEFYSEEEIILSFEPYAKRISKDISSLPNYFGYDDFTNDVLHFDEMSISGYFDLIGMPSSDFLRKGLEMAYVTEYGLEANEQTAINFLYLFYINPGNNSFDIFGISDERYKISGGNQLIIDHLYSSLKEQLIFNAELTSITKNNSNVYTLNFNGANSVNADVVVLALPFTLLRKVDFSGLNLPFWKTNAIQNLGYGNNAKLILGFNNRNWRNYGHSGYIFTNGSPIFSSKYIQTGWDSSQLQPGSNGSFTVFQGGRQGKDLSLSDAPVFLKQLESLWPGTEQQFNGNSKLIHWPSWKWSLGSYSCWTVGQVTTIKGAEFKPVDNLFFAGEHTSSVNQGYMEGGAETGRMVAKAIAVKVY